MVSYGLAASPGGLPDSPELFRIVTPDSVELPPRPALQPHWRALQAVVASGLAVIELMHDDGTPAEWFFDGAGRQSNDMGPWTPETRVALRSAFRPVITALRDTLLFTHATSGGTPAQPAILDAFLQLGPRLRDAIASALQNEVLPNPVHLDLGAPGAALPSWADPDALHRALSTDLQDRFLAGMRDGVLSWPSPIDGASMACTGAFTLDDFNSVFRFNDAAAGLDVFIVATEHVSRVAGLYVPAHGVVVSLAGDQSRMVRQHVPTLGRYMLHHLAFYADSLVHGIAARPHRFATFLRGGGSAHLGHQLWNELTAIDALVTELPRERLPLWLVPGQAPGQANDGIEFYGPIDVLYPEIAGRIHRGLGDHRALVRHAYRNGLILFRATRQHIGEGLRRRVATLAALRAPAFPGMPGRSFMIGLRVENRTLVDLPAFCALVIDEAIQLHPGCTIVFDGHNARGDVRSDHTIDSHHERHAGQSLLAVERGVVEAMRAHFKGASVTILDTLGEPLATSLAWAQACDGFVTPWGAGLAKYRWVANRPGFVVTSRWNLENRGDPGLYDGTAYMADPTPQVLAPAEIMRDRPGAPMLVPIDYSSYWNFDYDPDAMRTRVRAFLQALSGPPAALAAMAVRKGWRQGSVDAVDTAVWGWAISDQEVPVVVEVVIDDAVVGRVACDMERPDLLAGGLRTSVAGFGFVIPPAFLDGAPRLLSVRYSDGKPLPLLSPNIGDVHVFRLGHPAP